MKKQVVHNYIYWVGLGLLVLFMPLSKFLTSSCQFLLLTNFIIELNFKEKFKRLKTNKEVIAFMFLFFCPIIWCLNATNMQYAINDIIIILPLFALPLIISTSEPIPKNKFNIILIAFIIGVFLSSFLGFLAYNQIIMDIKPQNIREMSPFISSIRLGLMCGLSIFIIIYWFIVKYLKNWWLKIIGLLFLLWFIYFIIIIEAFTAIIAMLAVIILFLFIWANKEKRLNYKILKYFISFLFPIIVFSYIFIQIYNFYMPTSIQNDSLVTKLGNEYTQNFTNKNRENGNLIWLDICDKELAENWNKYSEIDLHGEAHNGHYLYITLIRYMTSKGLKKDAEGLSKLTPKDIENIENGIFNYRYFNKLGIFRRIYEIISEINDYYYNKEVYETSVASRIELQRAGFSMVKDKFWFGAGTGGLRESYNKYYETTTMSFEKGKAALAHNQFLSFFICYGIFGGIICLLAWIIPIFKKNVSKNELFIVLFIMASVSMFADDMLTTTTAVVFVTCFYSLFLWGRNLKENL